LLCSVETFPSALSLAVSLLFEQGTRGQCLPHDFEPLDVDDAVWMTGLFVCYFSFGNMHCPLLATDKPAAPVRIQVSSLGSITALILRQHIAAPCRSLAATATHPFAGAKVCVSSFEVRAIKETWRKRVPTTAAAPRVGFIQLSKVVGVPDR